MNLEKVQAFMDSLNLDVAVERVGENNTIPPSWRPAAHHYRSVLIRPGAREFQWTFSVIGTERALRMVEVVYAAAVVSNGYERYPTLEAWCAATGADPQEIGPFFHTFEEERRGLMIFFGDHYPSFPELAND